MFQARAWDKTASVPNNPVSRRLPSCFMGRRGRLYTIQLGKRRMYPRRAGGHRLIVRPGEPSMMDPIFTPIFAGILEGSLGLSAGAATAVGSILTGIVTVACSAGLQLVERPR